jgi:glutamine amidotransferase
VIAVVDYGVNNVRSVVRAIAAGGHQATLTADPAVVRQADRVILPGVGHFGAAVTNLAQSGLGDAVSAVAQAGRPVLGICLGMQLFFDQSEEAPDARGLGLLPGSIRLFRTDLPVPHVGWAEVQPTEAGAAHPVSGPVFHGEPQFFYHVHSFHAADAPAPTVLATADYAGAFPTVVSRDNVLGCQFHPEKSQRVGIDLLARFAGWRP